MMKIEQENTSFSLRSLTKKAIILFGKFWSIQFFRFLVTGGINTLFGYAIYTLLILLQVHFSIASLCSTILGVIFNFFTTGRIVFKNKNIKLIYKFIGVYGITYLTNLLFLSLFDHYHANMVFAGAILLIPIAIFSYILNKILVFK